MKPVIGYKLCSEGEDYYGVVLVTLEILGTHNIGRKYVRPENRQFARYFTSKAKIIKIVNADCKVRNVAKSLYNGCEAKLGEVLEPGFDTASVNWGPGNSPVRYCPGGVTFFLDENVAKHQYERGFEWPIAKLDMPVRWYDIDGVFTLAIYYDSDGKRHREQGPALISACGRIEYYSHGESYLVKKFGIDSQNFYN